MSVSISPFITTRSVSSIVILNSRHRINSAYCPKTARTHTTHLTLLLQFLQFIPVDIANISHLTILAFIELLQFNGLSSSNIQAHISSLRSQFKSLSIPTHSLSHHTISLALRSLALHVPSVRRVRGIFDIQTLHFLISLL